MRLIDARPRWHRTAVAAIALSLVLQAVVAFAQETTDETTEAPTPDTVTTQPQMVAPQVGDLPGELLIASTRESPTQGDTVDKYRLYTLRQGHLSKVQMPDEALGSTSAGLSQNGQQLLVNAGGQVLYVLDMSGAQPPRQLLDRLPALSLGQTDTYLSVAISPDGTRGVANRPHPVGMALITLADGKSAPWPVIAQYPSFSPDGTGLAMSYIAQGAPTAAIFSAPIAQPDALAKASSSSDYETAPQWQAGGSGVAYVAAAEQWQVRQVPPGSSEASVLAQAPAGFVISEIAVSPDHAWVAYTLQSKTELHRLVHISSISDPRVGMDLPQDTPWNDRVLGWVPGA